MIVIDFISRTFNSTRHAEENGFFFYFRRWSVPSLVECKRVIVRVLMQSSIAASNFPVVVTVRFHISQNFLSISKKRIKRMNNEIENRDKKKKIVKKQICQRHLNANELIAHQTLSSLAMSNSLDFSLYSPRRFASSQKNRRMMVVS